MSSPGARPPRSSVPLIAATIAQTTVATMVVRMMTGSASRASPSPHHGRCLEGGGPKAPGGGGGEPQGAPVGGGIAGTAPVGWACSNDGGPSGGGPKGPS
ncbi:MAG: hypothetical protein R2710_23815 [Acidimicrobiales bacterium]